jgi:hypothetical protein
MGAFRADCVESFADFDIKDTVRNAALARTSLARV